VPRCAAQVTTGYSEVLRPIEGIVTFRIPFELLATAWVNRGVIYLLSLAAIRLEARAKAEGIEPQGLSLARHGSAAQVRWCRLPMALRLADVSYPCARPDEIALFGIQDRWEFDECAQRLPQSDSIQSMKSFHVTATPLARLVFPLHQTSCVFVMTRSPR
jgi:hypothetical protein